MVVPRAGGMATSPQKVETARRGVLGRREPAASSEENKELSHSPVRNPGLPIKHPAYYLGLGNSSQRLSFLTFEMQLLPGYYQR